MFTPLAIKWRQRFCSKRCADKHVYAQRRGNVTERPCEWCGSTIATDRRTDTRFCNDICQSHGGNRRRTQEIKDAKDEQGRICPCCLAPLSNDKNKNAIFCSRECKLIERNIREYGIGYQDKLALLAAQGGVCAICKTDNWGVGKGPAIDHCHSSKRIRGLLCTNCNQGLGRFHDDIELLRSAIEYLMLG